MPYIIQPAEDPITHWLKQNPNLLTTLLRHILPTDFMSQLMPMMGGEAGAVLSKQVEPRLTKLMMRATPVMGQTALLTGKGLPAQASFAKMGQNLVMQVKMLESLLGSPEMQKLVPALNKRMVGAAEAVKAGEVIGSKGAQRGAAGARSALDIMKNITDELMRGTVYGKTNPLSIVFSKGSDAYRVLRYLLGI